MTMTKEQAIQILSTRDWSGMLCGYTSGYTEALDMAIEALENEPIPCEKCIHVKSCRKVILLKDKRYKLIRYCSNGVERKKP
jgi:hypothetical protein